MKIIPVYLPQFHTIVENDQWWGKGFTEWTNMRKAQPLFAGHNQPRIPLNNNYYDLSQVETLKWQAELAKKHGIYGFAMYHYWFNGHLLLEKPMEMLLEHPEIDLKYCISWANHDWTDSWKSNNGETRLLIGHDFDDEKDWVAHFNYMLPFFKDPRYISENNKPFMIVYAPHLIRKIDKMLSVWDKMAKEAGFAGLTFIAQSAASYLDKSWNRNNFDHIVQFHPQVAENQSKLLRASLYHNIVMLYRNTVKKWFGIKRSIAVKKSHCTKYDYDEIWQRILAMTPDDEKTLPSAFVDWDNTPRRQNQGTVYIGSSPEKFEKYFRELVRRAKDVYKTDKVFMFAWNEWAEGGYLEPDEKHGHGYLEAIKKVLDESERNV